MSHFAFDRRQQGLLAAGAMALPLMLVFAARPPAAGAAAADAGLCRQYR